MNWERIGASFTVFFAGVAAIVATVLTVYLFTFLTDKISCFDDAVLTEEEMEERRNATRVTKQSGLAGLLRDERNRIYCVFFERRSFPYLRPPETLMDNDAPYNLDVGQESNEQEMDEIKQANENDVEDGQAPTCSICLSEYDVGDKVILGSACSHMFHYDCCMQWVDKGNEHCPYCRKYMITPVEFYQTAVEVVGEPRVNKLKKINQAAAERMAALVASGEETIASPVPPVGQTIHNPVEGAVIVVASPGTRPVEPTDNTIPSEQHEAKDDAVQSPNDDHGVDLACADTCDPVLDTTVHTGTVTDVPI